MKQDAVHQRYTTNVILKRRSNYISAITGLVNAIGIERGFVIPRHIIMGFWFFKGSKLNIMTIPSISFFLSPSSCKIYCERMWFHLRSTSLPFRSCWGWKRVD